MKASQKESNKRKFSSIKVRASQRLTSKKQPADDPRVVHNKKTKKTRKRNAIDLEHMMSWPKATYKRKLSMIIDSDDGPSS